MTELAEDKMQSKITNLARSGHEEQHLFLGVRPSAFSYPIFDFLAAGRPLPLDVPELPGHLSQLWLTTGFKQGGVVRAVAGQGWLPSGLRLIRLIKDHALAGRQSRQMDGDCSTGPGYGREATAGVPQTCQTTRLTTVSGGHRRPSFTSSVAVIADADPHLQGGGPVPRWLGSGRQP
jgi:hypothetical protein